MDSIAFSPVDFSGLSVSSSDARFSSLSTFGEESTDLDIDFTALMSSLAGTSEVETLEMGPSVSITPGEDSPLPAPSDVLEELEPLPSPIVIAIIPWAFPTTRLALDISFVSANEQAPSLGDGSAPELPQEEGQPPVIKRVPPGELSFTGRIPPAFERLDQRVPEAVFHAGGIAPEATISKAGLPATPVKPNASVPVTPLTVTPTGPVEGIRLERISPKASAPVTVPAVSPAEGAEEIEPDYDPAVPAAEPQQPVVVATSNSPAPISSNQPLAANAISAPTSLPPPLQTESKDRTFQVRIGIEDTDVHLRIAERSGELHLAVSASTADAAGRLRDGLPDLMNALQTAGHDAEFWKASPASSVSSSSKEAGEQSFHDDSHSRRQQSGQGSGRRRKNRSKDYDPDGVASLA
jgi:hypothetical protein